MSYNVCDPIFHFNDETKTQYKTSSPFTHYFEDLFSKNVEEYENDHDDCDSNIYFNNSLWLVIKNRLHLTPLWSWIIFSEFDFDFSRRSNNMIESCFKYFKNHILNVNKHVRSQRLLFTTEVAAPIYNYLKFKYKEFYEDRFNFFYQNENKIFSVNEVLKEQWGFKKPYKKNEANYHEPTDLSIIQTDLKLNRIF